MIIFTAGGIIFYNIVRTIVIRQITNSLITEKKLIEEQILNSDTIPDFTTIFGHDIEVAIFNRPFRVTQYIGDTIIIKKSDAKSYRYRYLQATGMFRNNMGYYRGYSIKTYKSLSDTQKLILNLFIVIWLALISMLALLSAVNLYISKKLWIPFYTILSQLSKYNINENLHLNLTPSGIREFDQLNRALNAMSERIRADFINLKEFTEDASHEIHTPLAIIKSKIELLFQSENLTKEQLKNIRTIYDAVSRLARLNNSLLLISRIQNQQYPEVKEVMLSSLIEKFLSHFEELIQQKKITIEKNYNVQTTLIINPDLAEILISNLLGNALKHNIQNGTLSIQLDDHELTITNTGKPLDFDPHNLFKRFRKGNHSGDSTGLGLSIVKKIIDPYKFNIEYSTRENIHTLNLRF
jgi:signal transduction histidine kinase